jgi:hypothetical protein
MEHTANRLKWSLLIFLFITPFFVFAQKNSPFSFEGPKGTKDIMSYITSELSSEDTLKPNVCLYIFKLSGSGEISNVENLENRFSNLNTKIDSIIISRIYNSKTYWIGSSDKSDYRWIVLPVFLGNPPNSTVSSGSNLFFSLREQLANLVEKLSQQMGKVIWFRPRFTILGIDFEA